MQDRRKDPLTGTANRQIDRRGFLALGGGVGGAVLLGACSSTKAGSTVTTAPRFPLGAAAQSKNKPVSITLWHSMQSANLTSLQGLTNSFNSSQSDVTVNLVNQDSYTDTLTLYTAALSGGNLPDVVQMESADLQLMIDSQSIVPAQLALDVDDLDLDDYLASAVDYYKVDGTIYALPFNVSSQVLYFDANAFTAAGLDPTSPPTTLDDLQSASQKIVSSGTEKYGMSLKLSPSTFEEWLAMDGQQLLNNNNGRSARATSVAFNDSDGQTIASFYEEMFTSKAAQPTSATTYDNLYAIAEPDRPDDPRDLCRIGHRRRAPGWLQEGQARRRPDARPDRDRRCLHRWSRHVHGQQVLAGAPRCRLAVHQVPDRPSPAGELGRRQWLHPRTEIRRERVRTPTALATNSGVQGRLRPDTRKPSVVRDRRVRFPEPKPRWMTPSRTASPPSPTAPPPPLRSPLRQAPPTRPSRATTPGSSHLCIRPLGFCAGSPF